MTSCLAHTPFGWSEKAENNKIGEEATRYLWDEVIPNFVKRFESEINTKGLQGLGNTMDIFRRLNDKYEPPPLQLQP